MNDHFAEDIHEARVAGRDLAYLFLGKRIGEGMSRHVYEHGQDSKLVIKHERNTGFQNIIEWEMWQAIKETKYAKWFAPCVDISANGCFLIQKRVEKIPKKQYPKKIPAFFTDLKYDNFGMLDGKFVCFDYGTIIKLISLTNAMRKAKWWDENER